MGTEFALGIDLGGTKTEAVLLDAAGAERWRLRVPTPAAQGYAAVLAQLAALAGQARAAVGGAPVSLGIGGPGTLAAGGRLKNANTTCLNGRTLPADLAARLGQPVRYANDANCLALSEATDGAGAGAPVVFAAILGTGVGAGIAVHGRVLSGPNGLAGEWGHNPLPWADAQDDGPPPACYCGQRGCTEAWLSGPALAADHARRHGGQASALQIAHAAAAGDARAADSLARWRHRLARALAGVINLLDPDVVVLGGGLSGLAGTCEAVPRLWSRWVFSAGAGEPPRTRLCTARHGDASGVRGAAWLGRAAALSDTTDHRPGAAPAAPIP